MAKTIFHTTEKSNFILNLSTERYQGYLLRILLGYAVLMPLFCIPLEFAGLYTMPGMALSIVGVFAMVFVLIGFMKKVTPASLHLPGLLWLSMAVWAVVSLSTAYEMNIALFGADGRNEGLLSVIFYGCIFLLSAQLGSGSNRQKLMNGLLVLGLVQCLWALLQSLPFGLDSYYKRLDPLLLFEVRLPSGLTGSPIFLAILLVMLEPAAVLGAAFGESKRQRIFSTVCAVCYAVIAVKTQTLIGIGGMAAALLLTGIYAAVKKQKSMLPKLAAVLAAGAVGCIWVFLSPTLNGTTYSTAHTKVENQFTLYDSAIIWQDSSYRLCTSGYYSTSDNPNGTFTIESITDSYGYLWSRTLEIIKEHPVAGTGPDNLVYAQMNQSSEIMSNLNAFDRCYNYYLHLAATMGIPGLLLFLALVVIVLIRGARQLRQGGWRSAAIYSGVILYLAAMIIGTSAVTVTPIFWMLAGCAFAENQKA